MQNFELVSFDDGESRLIDLLASAAGKKNSMVMIAGVLTTDLFNRVNPNAATVRGVYFSFRQNYCRSLSAKD